MSTEPKKEQKKDPISPVLERVLRGGSSVSLNLIKNIGKVRTSMFANPILNRTIIFKYPNFEESSEETQNVYDPTSMRYVNIRIKKTEEELNKAMEEKPRPIETAIFVPYDIERTELGGHGIYLRKHNYQELMLSILGINMNATDADSLRDAKVLGMIDQIPSLDPFLLKEALLKVDRNIDQAYFQISDEETIGIKLRITAKLMPILERALRDDDAATREQRSRRFLDAIWNPDLPEAEMFIAAFGINRSETAKVFEALKGISFYEHNVLSGGKAVTEAVKWLQSDQTLPIDARAHESQIPTLMAYRHQIVTSIKSVSRQVGDIFKTYNAAHQAFRENDDPKPIRLFLMSVNRHYWTLGYGAAALANVAHFHGQAMRTATKGKLSFNETMSVLTNMKLALQSSINPGL